MKNFVLTTLTVFICFNLTAQKLVKSRKTSFFTYVYKISDNEAYHIYKRKKLIINEANLHTLVDSFPTDSDYQKKLAAGHYLKVGAENNQLRFSIASVYPFEIHVLDNNTDLCVQLYDSLGNIIRNAELKVKEKKLRFDNRLQAFIHKKSNKKGLLKIYYNNQVYYINLSRKFNNSIIKRAAGKVFYGTPIKYVWVPVRFIYRLPVDGTRSIIKRYPYGVINNSVRFFKNLYEKVACIFDEYSCDEYKFENKHKGYLVFNKPKYLPGDTVKFKAFITNKKGQPINKDVEVVFRNGKYKEFKLTKLQSYRKGAFEYQFYLHDSLELQLDTRCHVELRKKGWKTYFSNSFQYEDYELSDVNLSVRMPSKNHYKGKPFEIYLSGKDENNLNLMDGRYEIRIKPKRVNKYFEDHLFLADTLWSHDGELMIEKETKVVIPDSIFPIVNMDYELNVLLLSADNDADMVKKTVQYYSKSEEIKLELTSDSMLFYYLENGNKENITATVYAVDNFGNYTNLSASELPFKTKISPYFRRFEVKTQALQKSFYLKDEDALLQCFTNRTFDSIHIEIENPRKLAFNYFIYKVNDEIAKGYGTNLSWKRKDLSEKNYYISLQYLWGGEIQNKIYEIPYIENRLNIAVEQPELVYPGQKTKINLKITNSKGEPVPDVDVTAFSLTNKLKYTVENVPEFEKYRKRKSHINSFNLKNYNNERIFQKQLDYQEYKNKLGLDSIEYFKFLYPEKKLYHHEDSANGNQTQFSAYVVNNGKVETVHIIYLDLVPVYFSWSDNVRPYSFKTTGGFHNIRIRTSTKEFFIDSVYFSNHKKNIISLSDSINLKNVRVEERKMFLSDNEKQNLYRYVFPYRANFNQNPAYLEQNGQIINLSRKWHYGSGIAGPVLPKQLEFNLVNQFKTQFTHEPYFQYEFSPNLLKMRTFEKKYYPGFLSGQAVERLNDSLLSKRQLMKEWRAYFEKSWYERIREKNAYSTNNKGARLVVDYDSEVQDQPIFLLLRNLNENEFLRIRQGNQYQFFHKDKEYYQLVLIFKNERYSIIDSLPVQPRGVNYFRFYKPKYMMHGIFSADSAMIEYSKNQLNSYGYKPVIDENNTRLAEVKIDYDKSNKYNWRVIRGTILAKDDQMPLPGVNVRVKGTDIGTITDLDGNYLLSVPDNASELVFSFIGMETQEKGINGNTVNVELNSSSVGIDEVVVTALGISRVKKSLGYSVSTVSSNSLQGRVAGVSGIRSEDIPGGTSSVVIRGAGSLQSPSPLYVIDGLVYSGEDINLSKSQIEKMEVLKGAAATSIYGSRGASGVILITTKNGFLSSDKKGADFDDGFLQASMKNSSLRSNFSDYAFWQPKLKTDKNGRVSFEVTYPDDITSWKTYFLAMNNNKQTGQTESFVKSYKPLMAQLSVPRFLLEGDSTGVIGKVKNYTKDSVWVNSKLTIGEAVALQKKQLCKDIVIDTVFVKAENLDSLNISYLTEKEDGYFDGEKRSIPVFRQGLKETKGQFFVLDKDTSIELSFDCTIQNVKIYAQADVLDVVNDEIDYLINYKYACNEQLASKLIGLLAHKKVCEFKNKKFKHEKQVKAIIKKLVKNQQDNGLWGWWGTSGKSYWISHHAINALQLAEKAGYTTDLQKQTIIENLVWQLESEVVSSLKIRILELLRRYKAEINYAKYIDEINGSDIVFYDELKLAKLRQDCDLKYDKSLILNNLDTTLFGNIFSPNKLPNGKFYENDIQASLLAYQILKKDTFEHKEVLLKMRNYFFEKRKKGSWQNTFESAQIIENILPDILDSTMVMKKSELLLSGAVNERIEKFPYSVQLKATDKLSVKKNGAFPIYFTAYQQYWNPAPAEKSGDFIINTKFLEQDSAGVLKSGKKYTLQATVTVKKDAEFVMIEVPIPASCSYNDKTNRDPYEVHREYFKEKVAIFCKYLPIGIHTFNINIIPRYTGTYTLNPAKVELMYFPTFNANNEMEKLSVN